MNAMTEPIGHEAMSLQPVSWKHTLRLNAEHGRQFVVVSAHHNHELLAVDLEGQCWWITRDGIEPTDETTSSSRYLIGDVAAALISDEWRAEIDRRVAILAGMAWQ